MVQTLSCHRVTQEGSLHVRRRGARAGVGGLSIYVVQDLAKFRPIPFAVIDDRLLLFLGVFICCKGLLSISSVVLDSGFLVPRDLKNDPLTIGSRCGQSQLVSCAVVMLYCNDSRDCQLFCQAESCTILFLVVHEASGRGKR
ncbi:uncharacterized protein LOC144763966 [Lissotriton helveticus]